MTQARAIWKERTSIVDLNPPSWLVRKFWGELFDEWLMCEGPAHCAWCHLYADKPELYKQTQEDIEKTKTASMFHVSFCIFLTSCLDFFSAWLWLGGISQVHLLLPWLLLAMVFVVAVCPLLFFFPGIEIMLWQIVSQHIGEISTSVIRSARRLQKAGNTPYHSTSLGFLSQSLGVNELQLNWLLCHPWDTSGTLWVWCLSSDNSSQFITYNACDLPYSFLEN